MLIYVYVFVILFAQICGSQISRSNAAPPAKDSLKKRSAYDQWALKHQRALPHSVGFQKHNAELQKLRLCRPYFNAALRSERRSIEARVRILPQAVGHSGQ